jgi:cysteinyl-tRNA synthetase
VSQLGLVFTLQALFASKSNRPVTFCLYNTFSNQKEEFVPLTPGSVRMYNCGPTVYGRPHIGNLRSFVFADVLRRWLEYVGFDVQQVMNITDVGHLVDDADEGVDKLQKQAKKEQLDPWAIAQRYSDEFLADLAALNFLPAMVYPRATDHIPEMLEMVEGLVAKGFAYETGGNVYFDVTRFPNYGQLSGNRVEDLVAGSRIAVRDDKRNPADFALWKSDEHHLMKWASTYGPHGFPGWHIECSAMARKHLGDQIDIHTGGEDNVFPHHECEIAQSEAFNGKRFATYWMHAKFLQIDGGKMSKSLGNVYVLDDITARGFEPRVLRYTLLRGHYRQPLNFTWAILEESRAAIENLDRLAQDLGRLAEDTNAASTGTALVSAAKTEFEASMNDDLNMSKALGAVGTLRGAVGRGEVTGTAARVALDLIRAVDTVLGVIRFEEVDLESSIQDRIAARAAARAAKDWAEGDRIRDELLAEGIALEDGAEGVVWRRV